MFSVFKRPFGSPNAVIYSYELSKLFLDQKLTSILELVAVSESLLFAARLRAEMCR
jgi:hypothetical protein